MPGPKAKSPFNWEDYERGRSSSVGSEGSLGSHVQFDAPSLSATSGRLNIPQRNDGDRDSDGAYLRHRRYAHCASSSNVTTTGSLTPSTYLQIIPFHANQLLSPSWRR